MSGCDKCGGMLPEHDSCTCEMKRKDEEIAELHTEVERLRKLADDRLIPIKYGIEAVTHADRIICELEEMLFAWRWIPAEAEEDNERLRTRISELEAIKMPAIMIDAWREVVSEYDKQIAALKKAGDAMEDMLPEDGKGLNASMDWRKAKGGA